MKWFLLFINFCLALLALWGTFCTPDPLETMKRDIKANYGMVCRLETNYINIHSQAVLSKY